MTPVRDDHAWYFPNINGYRTHVRLRVWPTKDGSFLVVATDLMLGAGLINSAESLVRAAVREFGSDVTVVRHFPAWTMGAEESDEFDVLPLDEKGVARPCSCTAEVLELLGAGVTGFPGDAPPRPTDADAAGVAPQSVHLARVVAAGLRLTEKRVVERDGPMPKKYAPAAAKDLDPLSQLMLMTVGLRHLTHAVDGIALETIDTPDGLKRQKRKERIIEAVFEQVAKLSELCDDEAAARATAS
ncbi:hypothetical protein OG871_40005 (plasmid) [Kitasatospora sp. NBC_00374]|uniref:hypothetical protein n=1 Tax=Kitasatospora sp. NBC_00374 TaxID=2975964 RepID=UPI002F90DCAB